MKKIYKTKYLLTVLIAVWVLYACEDFVAIDSPRNEISEETVFTTDETALAAMNGVYIIMNSLNQQFDSGLEVFTGLASDELDNFSNNMEYEEVNSNEIIPDNGILLNNFWRNAYQIINNANGVIEGMRNNDDLTPVLRDQLLIEALFVRAYVHFYLVNLFGPVPYIHTTDVETNNRSSRMTEAVVYENILTDLNEAGIFAEALSFSGDQTVRPTVWAVTALMARTYLYTEQWALAEEMATNLIEDGAFLLENDLNEVFRATSREAIWQLIPRDRFTTGLGFVFPITSFGPGNFGSIGATALTADFLTIFETNDARSTTWIGSRDGNSFPTKYKNSISSSIGSTEFPEYTVMLRFAEQYLIRAEARVRLGDISGAQQDLNSIRNRAGLPDTTVSGTTELLEAIMEERQRELFAEGGHRWLDLKRTGRATEVLAPLKPLWDATDVLWPVPEDEIFNNSNLLPQNPGY